MQISREKYGVDMEVLRRKKVLVILIVVLVLLLGLYLDRTRLNEETTQIVRGEAGEDPQEYDLLLDADGVLDDYDYHLSVDAQILDEETITACFEQAEQEIDEGFYSDGEDASCVTQAVHPQTSYADGTVSATWYLDDEIVDADGQILSEALNTDGTVVDASVQLECYGSTQWYEFAFVAYPTARSAQEQLLYDIDADIRSQLDESGQSTLVLPGTVDGVSLSWTAKQERYFWKFLLLAVALSVGIPLAAREREKEARKKRQLQMQLDYPVIISKLLTLNSSGMSISQIWNRLATTYQKNREEGKTEVRYAYEEMVTTNRQILDGESESAAWLAFGERIGLRCYHRFVRLLVENRQKGAKGWSSQLEREAEEAFTERRDLARKLGEEAGTKLLIPMILMLGIVIAIVIVPAFQSYSM